MTASFALMRKALGDQPDSPLWPPGVAVSPFVAEVHARTVHGLLTGAYAHGGGQVAPFADWWEQLQADDEYDPALLFLATDRNGSLVGVAHCWTSAFVKDLAVAERWRQRGLGTALLQHAFNVFRTRGAPWVDLKVEIGNPYGAESLYRQLGMISV